MSLPTFPHVEDFLNPLTESNPVGPYLSYEDEYFELEEARRADDDASSRGDWTRQRKTSDWNKIISLGEELLREKSKDLQVAAWLTQALAHVHGLIGMRYGLHLLRELQNRFWELVHPAGGDLELRQAVYEFLDEEKILPLLVRSVPLTEVNGVPDLSYWVQTVWLQPKLDRLPSFFKESGFFLDSARPVDPRKHALFDLMEETPMIGIPMRDWDGRSVSPRSISGSLVNEAICVGIISRTTSNSNHYFGAQPNGLHPPQSDSGDSGLSHQIILSR